jgi:hypothetical protein
LPIREQYLASDPRIWSAVFAHHVRARILVPGDDPGADVALEGLDAGVGGALDLLFGQLTEPAFHEVSQEPEVGVKWRWNRGSRSSQRGMAGVLWGALVNLRGNSLPA